MNAQSLLVAFFGSWQVRTLLGLIALDVVLGIACAIRKHDFQWAKLADFYVTNVLPYVLGYGVIYLAVKFIFPPGMNVGSIPVDETLVSAAWVPLVGTLGQSVLANFTELYRPSPLVRLQAYVGTSGTGVLNTTNNASSAQNTVPKGG